MYENNQKDIKNEQNYKAFTEFFKNDIEIKTILMNMAPKSSDEFNEESRIEYLDRVFSELKNIEFKVIGNLKQFGMSSIVIDMFNQYFQKFEKAFSELGYGYRNESLSKIYQGLFSNMKPSLVEKTKEKFAGYSFSGGLSGVTSMFGEIESMNELLHVMHSSIINDENILEAMPVIGVKKNIYDYDITLYGKENQISAEIFNDFPNDLDVGITDIVSMEDRTIMMVRDRGHALTIEIASKTPAAVSINYFIPKICNIDMVKKLPGINPTSITQSGAVGTFDIEKDNIKSIFKFIEKVPTDGDMPLINFININNENDLDSGIIEKDEEER